MSIYICNCEEEAIRNNCSNECDLCYFENSNAINNILHDPKLEEYEFFCPQCCVVLIIDTPRCFNCDHEF